MGGGCGGRFGIQGLECVGGQEGGVGEDERVGEFVGGGYVDLVPWEEGLGGEGVGLGEILGSCDEDGGGGGERLEREDFCANEESAQEGRVGVVG